MRNALAMLLALALLLALPACGEASGAAACPTVKEVYSSMQRSFKADRVAPLEGLDQKQCAAFDAAVWESVLQVDEYVHTYENYYRKYGLVLSKKDNINSLTRYADSHYPASFTVSGNFGDVGGTEYLRAGNAFFDAVQRYSVNIVAYANFGGKDYRDMLQHSEEEVDQCRRDVVEARLTYRAAAGLDP